MRAWALSKSLDLIERSASLAFAIVIVSSQLRREEEGED